MKIRFCWPLTFTKPIIHMLYIIANLKIRDVIHLDVGTQQVYKTVNAEYFEAIWMNWPKILVASYLHIYCVSTKFESNLKGVSIFHVNLTWNYSGRVEFLNFVYVLCVYIYISKTTGVRGHRSQDSINISFSSGCEINMWIGCQFIPYWIAC